jgi:epoxyqueuosine reductase
LLPQGAGPLDAWDTGRKATLPMRKKSPNRGPRGTAGRKSNAPFPRLARRYKEWVVEKLNPVFAHTTLGMAFGMWGGGQFGWLRHVPAEPRWFRRWAAPPVWPDAKVNTPIELKSYAGSQRDPEAENRAFAEHPLHDFTKTHPEGIHFSLRRSWTWLIPTYPALRRALLALDVARGKAPAASTSEVGPEELSRMIRAEGKRLGISEVGFAKAEAKYTFAEYEDPGSANIIVCILEQDWAATNTAPSSRAERAAFRSYGQLAARVAPLAEYIKDLGFDARPNDSLNGEAIAIHYAVEAGLGQLGLNGQLLTPMAGSRCRLALITTQAPVMLGRPVDYGIPRICDECQVCVRRCPPGAIPKARRAKRGVIKAAIKPERCFPVVAQAHGCAVCMKVCPVQRYGLPAVTEHLLRTGQILGKGSDELEGYVWPLNGRYYGPSDSPRINSDLISPPGWHFDRTRLVPLSTTSPLEEHLASAAQTSANSADSKP